jgi:hypothetical protein
MSDRGIRLFAVWVASAGLGVMAVTVPAASQDSSTRHSLKIVPPAALRPGGGQCDPAIDPLCGLGYMQRWTTTLRPGGGQCDPATDPLCGPVGHTNERAPVGKKNYKRSYKQTGLRPGGGQCDPATDPRCSPVGYTNRWTTAFRPGGGQCNPTTDPFCYSEGYVAQCNPATDPHCYSTGYIVKKQKAYTKKKVSLHRHNRKRSYKGKFKKFAAK